MHTPRRRSRLAHFAAAAALTVGALSANAAAHSPHDVVIDLEISPTFSVDQTLFAVIIQSEHELLSRSTDGGLTWSAIGITPLIHGYQDLSFSNDFANDGTCFLATNNAGIWRSTDAGDTWQRINAGLASLKGRDVAVSPNFSVDQTVVAITLTGVYRSTDAGDNWTLVTDGVGGTLITSAYTVYDTPGTIFAARDKLFRSLDSGATWQELQTFANPIEEIAASPSFDLDQTMLVSFGRYGGGIMASDDGGVTFSPMTTGLGDDFVNGLALADDGTVFACTQLDSCYRAASVFDEWTLFDEGFEVLSDLTTDHYAAVRVTPNYSADGVVFVGGFEGLFRSSDFAQTFHQRNIYPVKVVRAIDMSSDVSTDGKVFVGAYGGGVYRLSDTSIDLSDAARSFGAEGSSSGPVAPVPGGPLGASGGGALPASRLWTSSSMGIDALFSATLQVSPDYSAETPTLFYTYQGIWRSTDDGKLWTEVPTPAATIIRFVGIAPKYPTEPTFFIGTNAGAGTWRSFDGGDSWVELTNGLPAIHSSRYIRISPRFTNDRTVFISTKNQGIFRSTDAGDSFTDISGLVPSDAIIRSFVISPTYNMDSTLFVGTKGDGLWFTTNMGNSWQAATTGLPDASDMSVESIAMSPRFSVDGTVFIATQSQEVFKSTDFGVTWLSVSADLPQTGCWAIDVSPNFIDDQRVIVSTNDWLWESLDAGNTWSRMPTYARIDDLYNEVRYEGFWPNLVFPGNLSFGTRFSNTPGNRTSLTFDGNEITWHGVLGPEGGFANVLIDGELVAVVDTYAPEQRTNVRLFSLGFETSGLHEITIEVAGTSNPASAGVTIQSDGFSYRFEGADP